MPQHKSGNVCAVGWLCQPTAPDQASRRDGGWKPPPLSQSLETYNRLAVRASDHPAHRSTRYHWAAGLNPWHWVPSLGAWLAVFLLGLTAMGVPVVRPELSALIPFLVLGALGWSGYWLIAVPNMPRFKRATDARLR